VKKFLIAAVVVLGGLAAYLHFSKPGQPAPGTTGAHDSTAPAAVAGMNPPAGEARTGASQTAVPGPGAPALVATAGTIPSVNSTAPLGRPLPGIAPGAKDVPPSAAVQIIRRSVHQFDQMFGGGPVGNNSEITAQLSGQNPKQINFLSGQDGVRINQNGELVDAWGTPYFFHQLSGSDMEVRSAGPDRKMWTPDDVLTR